MGLFDKFKDIINLPEDDFYDDENSEKDFNSFKSYEEEEEQAAPKPRRESRFSSANQDKVVNIHTTAQLQVVLAKPESFEEGRKIADNLNEKRTVVLNLESANRDVALRLIDFLSGVAYANNGNLKRVAKSTFIITPYNVDVMGDLLDELESNGMFF